MTPRAGHRPSAVQIGTCHTTGKRQHPDRKTARWAARHLYPHTALRAYQCDHCTYTHIGNTPEWIRRGEDPR